MFPKFKDKWRYQSFVNAKTYVDLFIKKKSSELSFPKKAIICYHKSIIKLLAESYPIHKLSKFNAIEYKDQLIIIEGDFGIGAPAAVIIMEELIILGVEQFISIGLAGGIDPSLEIGSYVICDQAFRDEGTSYHYAPEEQLAIADNQLVSNLEKVVKKRTKPSLTGKSWTTDAPYRETKEEILFYQKLGALTVEMECSALYIVAKCKNVSCASIFTVSDLLTKDVWMPKFDSKKIDLKELVHIALDALTL